MVEALQCVFWEIFHPQQADGLWVGGAIQQGHTLEDLQQRTSHLISSAGHCVEWGSDVTASPDVGNDNPPPHTHTHTESTQGVRSEHMENSSSWKDGETGNQLKSMERTEGQRSQRRPPEPAMNTGLSRFHLIGSHGHLCLM